MKETEMCGKGERQEPSPRHHTVISQRRRIVESEKKKKKKKKKEKGGRRIEIGWTRHPFHSVSARCLASERLRGPRFLGRNEGT